MTTAFLNLPLDAMTTESQNIATQAIDTLSTLDMLTLINNEDQKVALAVQKVLPQIATCVDKIAHAFMQGGRLIYCGAGTSGRLGILDASECPPTFGTPAAQVVGLIAGGHAAILRAVENAEDNFQQGEADLQAIKFTASDVLVAIAASGRTPYVLGAMQYALTSGAFVAAITCNEHSEMARLAECDLSVIVGAEVITGSSRLKAGTAQKFILNMLSTAAMVKTGKVYGNLMVDVQATNAKLIERQKQIVIQATDCSREQAEFALTQCNNHCKTAIVMILTNSSAVEAGALLEAKQGFIRDTLLSE